MVCPTKKIINLIISESNGKLSITATIIVITVNVTNMSTIVAISLFIIKHQYYMIKQVFSKRKGILQAKICKKAHASYLHLSNNNYRP